MDPRFRLRSQLPDWEAILQVDIDKMIEDGRAGTTLNALVDTLCFSNVTPRELRRVGHDATARYIRLLQLTVEYLLHVQESALAAREA